MPKQILIHEEAVNQLEKYCSTRPATTPIIIDRILREWWSRAAEYWKKNTALIPNIPKVSEKNITGISINSDNADIFMEKCKQLDLNPTELASWLCARFYQAYNMKKMIALNKKRRMEKW